MNAANTNARSPRQQARMVMHEDEHRIIRAMLRRALGDDGCFGMVVASDRSEFGRAEDRRVLARFLERMERQFELRSSEHDQDRPDAPSQIDISWARQGSS
jgi:hypothetical protein